MTRWDDARKAVWSEANATWPDDGPSPYVPETGWEDRTHYLVVTDSLEWVQTGDPSRLLTDAPWYLVGKADLGVELLGWEAGQSRADDMRPVGNLW